MTRALCLFPLLALALVACGPPAGPAQRAGQSLDRAAESVRDVVDPPSGPAKRPRQAAPPNGPAARWTARHAERAEGRATR